MQTRYATELDIPQLVRVINAAYRVEDFFVDGDRTTTADVKARLGAPGACFIVAESNEGSLLGAVSVEVRDDHGHFAMLSVDPPHQGRRLGRLLLEAVETHCRAAGCVFLDLEIVNLRRELPAFYLALGFESCGEAEFHSPEKLKRPAHLILMTKRLG